MKKNFLIIHKGFWIYLTIICIFLSFLPLMFYIISKKPNTISLINYFYPRIYILFASWGTIIILKEMIPFFKILTINKSGIKFKNISEKINAFLWVEIKDIYVYKFNGTDNIRIPYIPPEQKKSYIKQDIEYKKYGSYNLNGKIIAVPKKKPGKWIFIDDGRGENGENIFEYFVVPKKGDAIRLPYKDKIILKFKEYYKKEIIEKTIETN